MPCAVIPLMTHKCNFIINFPNWTETTLDRRLGMFWILANLQLWRIEQDAALCEYRMSGWAKVKAMAEMRCGGIVWECEGKMYQVWFEEVTRKVDIPGRYDSLGNSGALPLGSQNTIWNGEERVYCVKDAFANHPKIYSVYTLFWVHKEFSAKKWLVWTNRAVWSGRCSACEAQSLRTLVFAWFNR